MKTKLLLFAFLWIFMCIPAYAQEKSSDKSSKGLKSDPNIPIFEIKNDQNQTVFAVYPGGVKIFIEDQLKATGGGFTVGRLGTGKATGVNFLNVTPDSTRIYTNQNSEKGFAVGNLGASENVENFLKLNKSNYFIGHNSGSKTTGLYNLFLGYESGLENSTGTNNTFLGYQAGFLNENGSDNVFIGQSAGYSNISGSNNSFLGYHAGYSNNNGTFNAFFGDGSGYLNTSGNYNTLIGFHAGYNTGGSSYNTAVGYESGYSLSDWQGGVFVGYEAGRMITGRGNTALGASSGNYATSGEYNVFVGSLAGGRNDQQSLNVGSRNVFIGRQAGYFFGAGSDNVAIGYLAGSSNTGSGNVLIGTSTGSGIVTNNKLYIDNSSTSAPLIYGDFQSNILNINGGLGINGDPYTTYAMEINLDGINDTYALVAYGPTWCSSGAWAGSDIRFKENIVNYQNALDKIIRLRAVSFNWKDKEFPEKGFNQSRSIGVIAQEVEDVIPELVIVGPDGYKAVAYDKLTAVLIEGIKEQQKEIESLKSEIELIKTALKELQKKITSISSESASNANKN